MGGYSTVLKDFLSSAFKGSGESRAGTEAWKTFGAKDAIFDLAGKDGEAIKSLHSIYQLKHSQYTQQYSKPINDLQQAVYESPIGKEVNKNNTSIGQIYGKLKQLNHPAANIAGNIINSSPGNASKSLIDLTRSVASQARLSAGIDAFGDKMQNVMPIVMPYLDSSDPMKRHWAQTVLNVISNELHDTTQNFDPALKATYPASRIKTQVQKGITRENAVRSMLKKAGVGGVGNEIKAIDTKPTYTPQGDIERRAQGVLRVAQLSMVALKHLSQFGNLSSTPAHILVRGLLNMDDVQFRQFLDASSILAFTEHDMMDRQINGRFGKVASFTNPTAGDLFYRSYHMPFFDFVRTRQLTAAASIGYTAANDWARGVMHGDRRAIAELKEMGIDPALVVKQGGKLTNDQQIQAMFHFVNNRFFMDKSIERSLFSNSNWVLRSATMYHTFVNAQQRFIRRELGKMAKTGDFVGIAQFAGTIGVLFPAVAPMIKSLEIFGRTGSIDQAQKSSEDDYDKIWNGSFGDKASTYLDLLAHYGAFGVYTSYVQAARTNRLMYQLAGPTVGTVARGTEDLAHAVLNKNKLGKHNFAPVFRDVMEDTIPIAGNLMAHHLAPTAKEQGTHGRVGRMHRSRESSSPFEVSFPGDL